MPVYYCRFSCEPSPRLSFRPMAQCVMHALKGLACRARVTPATLPASHCKQSSALTSPALHARGCASPSRARRDHRKYNICFQWVQNLGIRREPRPRRHCCCAHAGMTILCSDKTGTLTQNKLSLSDPIRLSDMPGDEIIFFAALCSKRGGSQDAIDLCMTQSLTPENK